MHLIHSYHATSHVGHLSNINRIVEADRQKEMKDYLAQKDTADLIVTGNVRKGEPSLIIENEAIKKEADFVVMGTLGNSTVAKKIFGSTTSHIAKNLNIPVLAIPANVQQADFEHLVVALDTLNTSANEVVDMLIDFAQIMELKITLLHVSSSNLHTDLDPKTKTHLSNNKIDYEYQRIESEEILEGILDYANSKDNTILCLISRHRTWFGNLFHSSISQQMTKQTNMPLLILHDADS